MRCRIDDAEFDALEGLPAQAQLMYMRGIRPHMDCQTGIVGRHRKISWQGLREELEVHSHQGITESGKPSRERARRLLAWLERRGLIEVLSRHYKLVFRLPLATLDKSVYKKPAQNPHSEPAQKGAHLHVLNGGASENEEAQKPAHHPPQKPAPHQNSDLDDPTTRASAREDKHTPQTVGEWQEIFCSEFSYSIQESMSASIAKMCQEWIRQGVTWQDANTVMLIAKSKIGGAPRQPSYLRPLMEDYLMQPNEGSHGSGQRSTGRPGASGGFGQRPKSEREKLDDALNDIDDTDW